MKAGILTLHQADNYGAVLQAYALQQTLLRLGLENELINTDFFDNMNTRDNTVSKTAAVLAKRAAEAEAGRKMLFDEFRNAHLRCSEKMTKQDLIRNEKDYAVFITGSDQVWNLRVKGADACYFLPFTAPEKRISYAASFGSEDIPESAAKWCAEQLKDFAKLSVRETSAIDLIRYLTKQEAVLSLDPVFLLEKQAWEALIPDKDDSPYCFLYMTDYNDELVTRAKTICEETGLELKVSTATIMPRFGFDAFSDTGVARWLGLIAGAEGVFTNSFHGTAFSLIFEKPLMVSGLGGKLSSRSGRIEELLRIAGFMEAYKSTVLCRPLAGQVRQRLMPYINGSLDYLKKVTAYAKSL